MHSFFAEHKNISDDTIVLDGSVFNHIKNVLRLEPGDNVIISSGDNIKYQCEIKSFDNSRVICNILSEYENITDLPVNVTIFQGLPKSDKMDLIIQKSVELGAYSIVPVEMERSVVKYDKKKAAAKVSRWNTIALNAAQQSKRSILPEVKDVITFNDAINLSKDYDVILLPYECAEGFDNTRKILSEIPKGSDIAVFIGPEGGFDQDEIETAKKANAAIITLGKRILRTETVSLMILSLFTYIFEE